MIRLLMEIFNLINLILGKNLLLKECLSKRLELTYFNVEIYQLLIQMGKVIHSFKSGIQVKLFKKLGL